MAAHRPRKIRKTTCAPLREQGGKAVGPACVPLSLKLGTTPTGFKVGTGWDSEEGVCCRWFVFRLVCVWAHDCSISTARRHTDGKPIEHSFYSVAARPFQYRVTIGGNETAVQPKPGMLLDYCQPEIGSI